MTFYSLFPGMLANIPQETLSALGTPADTELSAVRDDLLVPCAPVILGENVHQFELGLDRIVGVRDPEQL